MANLMVVSGVAPAAVSTSKQYYSVMSESLTGRMQVRSLGGSRREFTISYPPMSRASFKAVYSFLDTTVNGPNTEFEIYIPEPYNDVDAFDFSTGSGCQEVTVRLKNPVQEFSIGNDSIYEFEIDVVEVLV